MNLKDLLELNKIEDATILWYGADICDEYLNDNGLIKPVVELKRMKPHSPDQIYLVMSGINKISCRYRFAVRFVECTEGDNYKWEKVSIGLDMYAGRMVFVRASGFSFYNSYVSASDFVLEEIWSKETSRAVMPFSDYSSIELSFDELTEIVENRYADYYKALSVVKGIYMIVDGNSGKLYVGSAYGVDGIWGRWSAYVNTYHGDNEELVKLFKDYGADYFKKFKYIILQILPKAMSDKEVIEMEAKYKERFLTREFGLNKN